MMVPNDVEFHDLMHDYFDGNLAAVQRSRFQELMASPQCAREFTTQARVHCLLHARLSQNMANEAATRIQAVIGQGTDTGVQRTVAGIVDSLSNQVTTERLLIPLPPAAERVVQLRTRVVRRGPGGRRRHQRSVTSPWIQRAALVAAILALGIGWHFWSSTPSASPVSSSAPMPAVARLTAGSAHVTRGSVLITLAVGDAVHRDDRFVTAASSATWQWISDGSDMTCAPDSRLIIGQSTHGQAAHIRIERGQLQVTARPQLTGDPMTVATDLGAALVTGTVFTVDRDAHGMRLQVDTGSVCLQTVDGQSAVEVAASQIARIQPAWSVPCRMWTTSVTPSDHVVDSFGMNLHLSYEDTSYRNFESIIVPRLQELGIRHVSDGDGSERIRQQVAALEENHIQIMWRMEIRDDRTPQQQIEIIHQLPHQPSAIMGVFHADQMLDYSYNGQRGVAAVVAYHNEVADLLGADPELQHVPLYQPSFSVPMQLNPLPQGLANCEIFPGNAIPESMNWDGQIINQAGYHTAVPNPQDPQSVNDRAVAYYAPRLWFSALAHGVKAVYWYELLDWADDPDCHWANYGVLRFDGTPKPVFFVLQRWLQLLADPAGSDQGAPVGTATLGFGGDVQDLQHVLWSRSDGSCWLALWRARSVFDGTTRTDVADRETSVVVASEQPFTRIDYYRPMESLQPQALGGQVCEISVPVGAGVTVLRLEGLYVQP